MHDPETPNRCAFALRAAAAISIVIAISSIASPARAALVATDAVDVSGINEITTSWSVTVDDFDGDGLPDILLGRHIAQAELYRNEGGSFEEIDAGNFGVRDRHECATADVDQDGSVDVFCNIGRTAAGSRRTSFELQQPDGTYVDRAEAFGVVDRWGSRKAHHVPRREPRRVSRPVHR